MHAFLGVVDFGLDVGYAVDVSCVHCQGRETFVDALVNDDVRRSLAELGHDVVVEREQPGALHPFGRVCAIESRDGELRAVSSPGAAAGVL